jgi:hypothetical protein
MAKAKKKAETQAEQSARFVRAAVEAGVDESGATFDRALRRIVPKKPKRTATGNARRK